MGKEIVKGTPVLVNKENGGVYPATIKSDLLNVGALRDFELPLVRVLVGAHEGHTCSIHSSHLIPCSWEDVASWEEPVPAVDLQKETEIQDPGLPDVITIDGVVYTKVGPSNTADPSDSEHVITEADLLSGITAGVATTADPAHSHHNMTEPVVQCRPRGDVHSEWNDYRYMVGSDGHSYEQELRHAFYLAWDLRQAASDV